MRPRQFRNRLFPRLALLIFLSLLSTVFIAAAILVNERTEIFFLAQQSPQIGRIERLLANFESVSEQQRRNLVNRFDAPNFHIEYATNNREAELGQEIALGGNELNRFLAAFTNEGSDYIWQLKWYRAGTVENEFTRVYAATTLEDGNFISFTYPLPSAPVSLSRAYLALVAALICIVVLTVVLVRRMLNPLALLTQHAYALGKTLDTPLLEEAGSEEVKAVAHAMNHMQTRLQDMELQRKQMLSAISHDLKTPITRMMLRTEFLKDTGLADKFVHDLADMEDMVNEALGFIKTQTQSEKVVATELRSLLREAVAEFREAGHRDQVNLQTPDNAVEIWSPVQPKLLKRCLMNLLSNGVKYGEAVTCALLETADSVQFVFTDRGPGLPKEQLEKVFDPFYRVESSRNQATGGHGLGLSICRQIAISHGGNVSLQNNPDGGLIARLLLPK